MEHGPVLLSTLVVLGAALAQTVRNLAQRSLSAECGAVGAALTRFLYGLPFTVVAVLVATRARLPLQALTPHYAGWLLAGAVAQGGATVLLLLAMERASYVVAVTYSKTEVLQVAVLGSVILSEVPSALALAGMAVAVLGVFQLASVQARPAGGSKAASRGVWFGVGSGASFALAAVAYRVAALDLERQGVDPWVSAGCSVLFSQLALSVLMAAWLGWREPRRLRAVLAAWRASLLAGAMGGVASIAWFVAYGMRPAAQVRALGLVEVLFGYAIARKLLRQKIDWAEVPGLLMVVVGAATACIGPAR